MQILHYKAVYESIYR